MPISTQRTREVEEEFKPMKVRLGYSMGNDSLRCAVFNTQSICNKCPQLMVHTVDHDVDVILLSETWLKSKKNEVTAMTEEQGYKLHHTPRKNRAKETGGGVGVLVKKSLTTKQIKVKQFQSFEHCVVKVCLKDSKWITFIAIYRLDYEGMDSFLTDFTELLEMYTASDEKFVIGGDINIHCDVVDDRSTIQLNELLSAFNLTQSIGTSTHQRGHTIDVVITHQDDGIISDIDVRDINISDHYFISFSVNVSVPKSYYKTITFHKKLDNEIFRNHLTTTLNELNLGTDFRDSMLQYNTKLGSLYTQLSPEVTKQIKVVAGAPWFDSEYAELRKQRRKAEKVYKRTRNPEDREAYHEIRAKTTKLAKEKKEEYYVRKIQGASNKTKELFKVINTLTDKEKVVILPKGNSDSELANNFLQFFKNKITKIRESFKVKNSQRSTSKLPENLIPLSIFEPATEDEIRTIVMSYTIKSSPEDPLPANLLKDNLDLLLPYWVILVNLSLSTGSMECLKSSVVGPLLKEADDLMDTDEYKNYRPVSNLIFLGKLIERCVATRLEKHMKINLLESKHEYGYKTGHSTEMLLVNVVDDLLTAFDKKQATVLLLLDLSAAFDTVDQDKLLSILENEIGITGIAYTWFESYLRGRTQRVKVNNCYSEVTSLDYGLTQGSVLGPPLFNIYVRPFYSFVHALQFNVEGFADDHQLFKHFFPMFQTQVLSSEINNCLKAVSEWMSTFFLKLNKSKTKILVLGPFSVLSEIEIHGMFMEDQCIRFVTSAKNLGVWLDENLDFKVHIRKVVSSCFMVIRDISKIKKFLPQESLCIVVCSLVLSILDYCNALYYNLNASEIKMLQSVQNAAIRLISGGHKYDRKSITPLFEKHHWLRIRERIVFKLCLLVHKCVLGIAPESLKDKIVPLPHQRTHKLLEKKFESDYGKRSFSCAGPKLWNNLPASIRTEKDTTKFKKSLKSYLMTDAEDFHSRVLMR